MSYFTDFMDEELDLVISMPVRIGFWMSHADDIPGTVRDEEKEKLAIEKVLQSVKSKTDDAAFTNDVVEEALRLKDRWPGWDGSSSTALDDLPRALSLVAGRLPPDADRGYRKMIYYVANVVAQAAAEKGGEDDLGSEVIGSGLISKILDRLSVKTDMGEPDNVSDIEKAALQKLLQCLKG